MPLGSQVMTKMLRWLIPWRWQTLVVMESYPIYPQDPPTHLRTIKLNEDNDRHAFK